MEMLKLVTDSSNQAKKGGRVMMLPHRDTAGQGLVEYALIMIMVVIVVFIVLAILGPTVSNVFSTVINLI
jgi:pilus assembly protein Flp/PilA